MAMSNLGNLWHTDKLWVSKSIRILSGIRFWGQRRGTMGQLLQCVFAISTFNPYRCNFFNSMPNLWRFLFNFQISSPHGSSNTKSNQVSTSIVNSLQHQTQSPRDGPVSGSPKVWDCKVWSNIALNSHNSRLRVQHLTTTFPTCICKALTSSSLILKPFRYDCNNSFIFVIKI